MNVGDVTLVEASGRITLGESVTLLRDQIRELLDGDRKKILLNLADVTYIDSSGIGEMVTAFTTVKRHGGSLKLLKLTQRVRDLLQITKLSTVFEVYEDESKALKSFSDAAH
jgi:anti-sigma B factor antagonist